MNYLLSEQDFKTYSAHIQDLHKQRNRVVYIVIAKKQDDDWVSIAGRTTSGSINIDGTSAIRRSISLTMNANSSLDIKDSDWTRSSRIKIWCGLQDDSAPEELKGKEVNESSFLSLMGDNIVWFPQGEYVIGSFSAQLSPNGWTINLSGKDLMVYLNGELGGTFIADTSLNFYEQENENKTVFKKKLTLEQTVQNILNMFCPDVEVKVEIEEKGYKLYKYIGDKPLYLIFEGKEIVGATVFGDETTVYIGSVSIPLSKVKTANFAFSWNGDAKYTAQVAQYGDELGYKEIPLELAEDLIAASGTTATAALDKIKSNFVGYEYYFDLEGAFCFKKKSGYTEYAGGSGQASQPDYEFIGTDLLTGLTITPDLSSFKNDYAVWGKKSTGASILKHFAIGPTPTSYTSRKNGKVYTTDSYDYRELIYQMALDELDFSDEESKKAWLSRGDYPNKPQLYSTFFPELRLFWRNLYDPAQPTTDREVTIDYSPLENEILYYYPFEEQEITAKDNYEDFFVQIENNNYTEWKNTVDLTKGLDLRIGENGPSVYSEYKLDQLKGIQLADKNIFEAFKNGIEFTGAFEKGEAQLDIDILLRTYEQSKGEYVFKFEPLDSQTEINDCWFIIRKVDKGKRETDEALANIDENTFSSYKNDTENSYYVIKQNLPFTNSDSYWYKNADGNPVTFVSYLVKGQRLNWNELRYGEEKKYLLDSLGMSVRNLDLYTTSDEAYFQLLWDDIVYHQNEEEPVLYKKSDTLSEARGENLSYNFYDTNAAGEKTSYSKQDYTVIARAKDYGEDGWSLTKPYNYDLTIQEGTEELYPERCGRRAIVEKQDSVRILSIPEDRVNINIENLNESAQELIGISTLSKSGDDALDEMLFNHLEKTESISLTSLPMYYLVPNSVVRLKDIKGLDGEAIVEDELYVLSKITVPLTYNGTSSLTLSRLPLNQSFEMPGTVKDGVWILSKKEAKVANEIMEVI